MSIQVETEDARPLAPDVPAVPAELLPTLTDFERLRAENQRVRQENRKLTEDLQVKRYLLQDEENAVSCYKERLKAAEVERDRLREEVAALGRERDDLLEERQR